MLTRRRDSLAVDGGSKSISFPWPRRGLFTEKEKAAVVRLFDRSIATGVDFGYNGKEEEAYCSEFAEFLGGGYADAVNSGTSAVYVALRALELEPFTEVICPPVTDPGGVMPVPLMNCIPIPADSAPDSYNAGPDQIEARITPRTSAIIVAHIAGIPAEMGPILEIARAHKLPVVEDCAQAHGAKYRGKLVGTLGDIGTFSTMFGKHHATGGQGGLVFTKSKELYWKIRRYSDRGKPFGLPAGSTNVAASFNLNLNDLSACVGRVQLKRLPKLIAARRKAALALAQECRKLKAVRMETGPRDAAPSFWFLFFKLDLEKLRVDKAAFIKALRAEGLPVDASYLLLFTRYDWYKNKRVFGSSSLPWSAPQYQGDPKAIYPVPNLEAADASHFYLQPFHERITPAQARRIAAAIGKVERAYLREGG